MSSVAVDPPASDVYNSIPTGSAVAEHKRTVSCKTVAWLCCGLTVFIVAFFFAWTAYIYSELNAPCGCPPPCPYPPPTPSIKPLFFINTTDFGDGHGLLTISNLQTGEHVSVVPSLGGMLQNLTLRENPQSSQLLSVIYGPRSYKQALDDWGWANGGNLIPWPGRIWGGRYSFQGVNYTTPLQAWEDSAWHGLLRYRAMSVEDMWNNTQEAGVRLGYTFDGSDAFYPFPLRVQITYTLSATGGYTCRTRATNVGSGALPFADGKHPYFTLGTAVVNTKVILDTTSKWSVFASSQPVSDYFTDFGFRGLDQCFVARNRHAQLNTRLCLDRQRLSAHGLPDKEGGLCLTMWQNDAYRYVQVFFPYWDQFNNTQIAIEPKSSVDDAFNNGVGLEVLEPGDMWEGQYGVYLDKEEK